MSGLLSILAAQPVFAIEPMAAQRLLSIAAEVLQGNRTFNPSDFVAMSARPRTERVYNSETRTDGKVFVLPIHGVMYAEDQECGPKGMLTQAMWLRNAANDPSITAGLLDIMSPGGSAYGNPELANAVAYFRSKKPIIAYVNSQAASAAYRVASECDHIMLNAAGTSVGSIGTLVHYLDDTRRLREKGYDEVKLVSTLSPKKSSLNFSEPTEEDKQAIIDQLIDPLAESFQTAVKSARPQIVTEGYTGEVFRGQKAVKMGLADSIGPYEQALAWANDETYNRQQEQENSTPMFGNTDKKITALEDQIAQMTTDHATAITELNEAHATAMEEAQTEAAQQLAALQAKYDDVVAENEKLKATPPNKIADATGEEGTVETDANADEAPVENAWSHIKVPAK